MLASDEIRMHLRGGPVEEVGRHNALPQWGYIVTIDPGPYVGRHRKDD